MKVHPSALKHGIAAEDALQAAAEPVYASEPDDENPAKQFRLGFDTQGRLLEVVALRFDSANELVIHAMKARRRHLELLN